MGTYLLFTWKPREPRGGWNDFEIWFDSRAEVDAYIGEKLDSGSIFDWQTIDLETMEVVDNG